MAEQPHTSLIVGVPKETRPGERRVAVVPTSVASLTKAGWKVLVESGAGTAAGFSDEQFSSRGAQILADRGALFAQAAVILQVNAGGANPQAGRADLDRLREGQILLALCDPLSDPETMQKIAARRVTCFALELLPRITRAQRMDVLSSMATVAGYKAVLLAASASPRMFPMLMTAAGTITPARVFVVGAGVAGLQAIATARRLGAVVSSYDVRPAVKEQVQSLGARFVELDLETAEAEQAGGYARKMDEEFYRKQREKMTEIIAESDVVITTAAVPGKKAPVLITAEMVAAMKPGSVLVDLAAERGGNCELTQPEQSVVKNGVTILGPCHLAASIPLHASEMYSRNITATLLSLVKEGALHIDRSDEIVAGALVTIDGEVVHPQVRALLGLDGSQQADEQAQSAQSAEPAAAASQAVPESSAEKNVDVPGAAGNSGTAESHQDHSEKEDTDSRTV